MKKSIMWIFVFCLLVVPIVNATIDDYIAYYPFDVVYNETSEFNGDPSGANGIVEGLDDETYKYGVNGSIDFDGTGDYITTGWNFNDCGSQCSWGVLIKTNNEAEMDIFSSNIGGNDDFHTRILANGKMWINVRYNSPVGEHEILNGTSDVADNVWHHIWVNWEQNGDYELWVDNILEDI